MMNNMYSIRKKFLEFFYKKKHKIIKSSSLIPHNDKSLLFTNSGMNQFKNLFLRKNTIKYNKIATSQRCLRVGGKHNDLENVGNTSSHHTFFEMLGNFSFGGYFKKEAIISAWELLTHKNLFYLPENKFWITVYHEDKETFDIWNKIIGIPEKRILRIGDNKEKYNSDNFWQMSDQGPCGPCTEIFFERENNISKDFFYKLKKEKLIEIWNIVFIQFNRKKNGYLDVLNDPSVDTGMGLERITSVLQKVDSNYSIDFFSELIKKIACVLDIKNFKNNFLKILADHIRAVSFLIVDGVIPSNTQHGYVLRRIIRRAINYGNLLGINGLFFYKLVTPLIKIIKEKDVLEKKELIKQIIKAEEKKFSYALKTGLSILNKKIKKINNNILDGKTVFLLYDTFGFPLDLIEKICNDKKIKIDKNNFKLLMYKQKKQSSKNNYFFDKTKHNSINIDNNIITKFTGYNILTDISQVLYIYDKDFKRKTIIEQNQNAIIILNKTPFYYESGGQIGDQGFFNGKNKKFLVQDTKIYNKSIIHIGKVILGSIKIGDCLSAEVNKEFRLNVSRNHSAIHLLNVALEKILGNKIIQKGSLANDKYFRFDFTYFQKINIDDIKNIENLINNQIIKNISIDSNIILFDNAKKYAKFLSEEVYDKYVRMITIKNLSHELCCGTHVKFTGEIGFFKIIKETSVSSGIRRIEGITGKNSLIKIQKQNDYIKNIAYLLHTDDNKIDKKINKLLIYINNIETELKKIKNKYIISQMPYFKSKILKINRINFLILKIDDYDREISNRMIKMIQTKLKLSVIILASIYNKEIFIFTSVEKKLINYFQANFLIKEILNKIGGNGGGSIYFAQGKGLKISLLKKSLDDIKYSLIKKAEKID